MAQQGTGIIRKVPASGPGALAGHEVSCPRCGLVIRTSLSAQECAHQLAEHERWCAAHHMTADEVSAMCDEVAAGIERAVKA